MLESIVELPNSVWVGVICLILVIRVGIFLPADYHLWLFIGSGWLTLLFTVVIRVKTRAIVNAVIPAMPTKPPALLAAIQHPSQQRLRLTSTQGFNPPVATSANLGIAEPLKGQNNVQDSGGCSDDSDVGGRAHRRGTLQSESPAASPPLIQHVLRSHTPPPTTPVNTGGGGSSGRVTINGGAAAPSSVMAMLRPSRQPQNTCTVGLTGAFPYNP